MIRKKLHVGLMTTVALCGGCTEVRVYHSDFIEVHHELGLVRIDVSPTSGAALVETLGAGVVLGQRDTTLGFAKEEVALFPTSSRCAVMIVAPNDAVINAVEADLERAGRRLDTICIAKGDQNGNESTHH